MLPASDYEQLHLVAVRFDLSTQNPNKNVGPMNSAFTAVPVMP